MKNFAKFLAASLLTAVMFPMQAFAISNVDAESVSACNATGTMLPDDGMCKHHFKTTGSSGRNEHRCMATQWFVHGTFHLQWSASE